MKSPQFATGRWLSNEPPSFLCPRTGRKAKGATMNQKSTGFINADEAYSKTVVLQRLGISQKFWDKMLDEGLTYTIVGHTRWVLGKHLMLHFERHSQTKKTEAD